jgi:hypothetical protein
MIVVKLKRSHKKHNKYQKSKKHCKKRNNFTSPHFPFKVKKYFNVLDENITTTYPKHYQSKNQKW